MALVKLKFSAYESDQKARLGLPSSYMYAQINPTGYELDHTNQYKDIAPLGSPEPQYAYVKPDSQVLSLKDVIIDQGVIMSPILLSMGSKKFTNLPTVNGYVEALKSVLYSPLPGTHIPHILNVSWGTFSFTGICTKFAVNYTLFSTLGFPLRAKLQIDFCASTSPAFATAKLGPNSPDLTHLRTANAGDNLPILSNSIYGNSKYYLELARVNNLNSVFDVLPGDKVVFPPLKK
jgi:hypothetical protein